MSRSTVNPLNHDWFRCAKCECSFLVKTDDSNNHLLKINKKFLRCPNYITCKGRITKRSFNLAVSGHIPKARHISALDLYHAISGLGLPGERCCSVADLKKIMIGSKIWSVHLEKMADPKRSIILAIELDNRKIIHITTSTKGAVVYKITER